MNKVNLRGIDYKTINGFKYIVIPLQYCKDLNIGYSYSPYEDNDVVCCQCNGSCSTVNYIGALNDTLCENCLEETLNRLIHYDEDKYYEDKNIRNIGNSLNRLKDL